MAEKSVDNMLVVIEKSKNRPLARFIYSLGIRHVGGETAELLARNFSSLDSLANASTEELEAIPAIGPRIADSITAFFGNKENKLILDKLDDAGVIPEQLVEGAEKLPLVGKELVITGRLNSLSRQEAEAKIRALGGNAKKDVTAKTDYLVVGDEPGSKLARARRIGIEQISEDDLVKLLGKKN
jgi:DNA ligase (NAD+)